ncbi:hypothetical protein K491DRAFT_715825 [Lophiostoma macrostomum CBS 122681]|uniref:Uncharacterized protein n=1 Tax=Lophiostoma macrostomum CBS 122681 TaxID=1314788 RepID=A0A6A6T8K4_9PLEO|nr:hypothetical protein K491DRAFT_715825 [Lophiostoma macrostomum CBS 122681]
MFSNPIPTPESLPDNERNDPLKRWLPATSTRRARPSQIRRNTVDSWTGSGWTEKTRPSANAVQSPGSLRDARKELSNDYADNECYPELNISETPDRVPPEEMVWFEIMQEGIDEAFNSLSPDKWKRDLPEFCADFEGYEYMHLLDFHKPAVPAEEMKGFEAMQEAIDEAVQTLPPRDAYAALQAWRAELDGYSCMHQLNWHDSVVPLEDQEQFDVIQALIDAVLEQHPPDRAAKILQDFRNGSRRYPHLKRLDFHDD